MKSAIRPPRRTSAAADEILIAPSILSGDFGKLAQEAKRTERAGADWLHIDIMDGVFVPNITIGPQVVASIRKATRLVLDVHLMIQYPQNYIKQFVRAGADIITVHVEAPHNISRTLTLIKKAGCRCGLVLNPPTPAIKVKRFLKDVDLVLVMSVHPGFGNQRFIPDVLPKIAQVRRYISQAGKKVDLEVDGGINPVNAKEVVKAGANILVAGGAVFGKKNIKKAIADLRKSVLR